MILGTGAQLAATRVPGEQRAVVMTMGALHDGHAHLIREARTAVGADGQVIVTIFVNPTQFGAGEDFDKYPRTLDDDVEVCSKAGANFVFAPSADEIYGPARGFTDDSVTVDPGPLGRILEGSTRPDHFRGVLTVVLKLMNLTAPDIAFFGEKDYQQLVLIRRMVRDLSLPVEIRGVPTVREHDGLALSSRNRYLSADDRHSAAIIPRALQAAVDNPSAPIAAAESVLSADPGFVLDYLTITDPDLGPTPSEGDARVLIAGKIGATRLIDNMHIRIEAS